MTARRSREAGIELEVRTSAREEFVDVTGRVQEALTELGLSDGALLVYVPHTTAGVTINEGADPDVRRDVLVALARVVPEDAGYRHAEGNSPAHVKASLVGASVVVSVSQSALELGRWQSLYLCEFDGPRARKLWLRPLGGLAPPR